MADPTVIAVDWSGAKKTGPKSGIWLAVIRDGRLLQTEAVSKREKAIALVQSCAPPVIAGFDFSFGAPGWFAEHHACATIDDVWALAERDGERWLGPPPSPPFWCDRQLVPPAQRFRQCEERLKDMGTTTPKSMFQLVGNGQVGAGSVRGMPHLLAIKPWC